MRLRCLLRLAVVLSLAIASGLPARADGTAPVTLILGAMDAEIARLTAALEDPVAVDICGLRGVRGRLYGREAAVARCGVGKVNAAMTTTLLLEHLAPSEVLFSGIAGALDPQLRPGDIVIGTATVQHDLTSTLPDTVISFAPCDPFSGVRNPVFLPADARLADLASMVADQLVFDTLLTATGSHVPRVVTGIIATGDSFIAAIEKRREIRGRLEASAVEMEGAAVAQVCHQWRTPCLVIRSISDHADERAPAEIERFYQIAAGNSARLVLGIVQLLGPGAAGGGTPRD